MAGGIITLTTDFGIDDPYVGLMKGVILGINQQAHIVDLCHGIRPFNVSQAAFVLGTSYSAFPAGTIHVAVVDPGVGSQRLAVLLVTPSALFLAPDNGLLSMVAGGHSSLPAGYGAFSLDNPAYWRHPVSATFHGRDIFAPVAAYLSLGIAPAAIGTPITTLKVLPDDIPHRRQWGILAKVIHIDHFGNLITNIRQDDIPAGDIEIDIGRHKVSGLARSYAEAHGMLALIGSSGHLEISVRDGNASRLLGVVLGDEVRLTARNSGLAQAPG